VTAASGVWRHVFQYQPPGYGKHRLVSLRLLLQHRSAFVLKVVR
jgi:hypothetical protein